jgi:thiazole synthase
MLRDLPVHILPNTAGCYNVDEAVTTAMMAREIFKTNWIKLEVIDDDYTLKPKESELVEAAKILSGEGFEVFPYMTENISLGEQLLASGCRVLMPWASPIGSGQGIINPEGLKKFRSHFKEVAVIIDAGLGCPSDAAYAMELGFDGVLLNTAVSTALDPASMAQAFALALEAGMRGFHAGIMEERNFAVASTPVVGKPFWHSEGENGSSQ